MATRLATVGVLAAAVFLTAFDDGSYELIPRHSLALCVWWVVTLALVFGVLPRQRLPRGSYAVGASLALLALVTALSSLWAPSREAALLELDRVLLYLGVFVLVVIAARRRDLGSWLGGLALALTLIAAVSLISRFAPSVFSTESYLSELGSENRLSFPLGYWNGLAVLTGMAFPLLLQIAVSSRPILLRSAAAGVLPALFAVIYLSSSRGGLLVALLGSVLFLALSARRWLALAALAVVALGCAGVLATLVPRQAFANDPPSSAAAIAEGREVALLLVGTVLLCALLLALVVRLPLARFRSPKLGALLLAVSLTAAVAGALLLDPAERIEQFTEAPISAERDPDYIRSHLFGTGGGGRWQFWQVALDGFADRPLTGQGAGSYGSWWAEHATFSYFVRDAHSLYLEALSELGVPGLLALCALLASALAVAWRRLSVLAGAEREAAAALAAASVGFAVSLAFDWMWELTAVSLAGFVCLGLLVGPATDPAGSERSVSRGRPPPRRLPAIFVAVTLAAAVLLAEALPLIAELRLEQSRAAATRGDADTALRAALSASRAEPWAASPHVQLALLYERLGAIGQARSSIARAIEADRRDWRLWLVSARLAVKAGAVAAARDNLVRARLLAPRSQLLAGLSVVGDRESLR